MPPESPSQEDENIEKEIHSYRNQTFLNAVDRFVPVIDRLIELNAEYSFRAREDFEMTCRTLQNRLSAVLRYLATVPNPELENQPKFTIDAYAKYKARTKFNIDEDKGLVKVRFKRIMGFKGLENGKIDDIFKDTGVNFEEGEKWGKLKENILGFLNSDERFLEIRGREKLGGLLDEEIQNWIRKTLDVGDIEFSVDKELVKILKT